MKINNFRNGNNNNEKRGTFAKIEQPIFLPLKQKTPKSKAHQTVLMDEWVEGSPILSNMIYQFDVGLDRFINSIHKYKNRDPKLQVIDNYYLYHYTCSIKNGQSLAYIDSWKKIEWHPIEKCFHRTIERTYLQDNHDFDSYLDYHLIVRIFRFQIDYQIFEIIIPRENNSDTPFNITKTELWSRILAKNLELPSNTQYIIRRKFDK